MCIRKLQQSDVYSVVLLHQSGMGQAAWSESQWQSVLSGRYRSYVIELAGEIAAVAVFHCLFEELELQTVAVSLLARRQGLAQKLIAHAVARESDAERLLLEVDADNRPAVALYEKLGFETTAVRKNYYAHSSGSGDALLMTKSIERQ